MKKLRRYLPVLILILALILLFAPSGNNSAGGNQAPASVQEESGPTVNTGSDADAGGELQLLEPAQDSGLQTAEANGAEEITETEEEPAPEQEEASLPEDGSYTTKEDVSLYLITYGHLPPNFVTKAEAEKAGWNGGSLEYVLPGKCIGGDRFGNREGQLPKAKGRTWWECDINTLGRRSRGAERLVYSSDGLIYYTPDHYETFTRLY